MILTINEACAKYNLTYSAIRNRVKSGDLTKHKLFYPDSSKYRIGVSEIELNELYHFPIQWYVVTDYCAQEEIPVTTFYKYANLQLDSKAHMRKYKNKNYVAPKFAQRIKAIISTIK